MEQFTKPGSLLLLPAALACCSVQKVLRNISYEYGIN
jgi:hypothetical protein